MTRELLHELARPRLFGTAGATHVADCVRTRFEALGLAVETQTFDFSAWPGRNAVPALGVLLTVSFGLAAALLLQGQATAAALTLGLVLLLLAPLPLVAGAAVDRLRVGRATGANLLARRPGTAPRFLVVAHRDSKSQPVPLGLRIAAVALIVVTLPGTVAAAAAGAVSVAIPLATAGAVAGFVLVFCATGNRSPGALDNASGLAALLVLAAREDSGDVSFLVTDAEELGLAGARAAARAHGVEAVINLDGLDDTGPLRLLVGRGRPAVRRSRHLRAALAEAARAQGVEVRFHHVPAGLMVDHLPFAAAGLPALTVMRGHLRALARVHRATDNMERITGAGADRVATIVEAALSALRTPAVQPPPSPSRDASSGLS